jgi:type II restriction/modification system DNA methylase subunit YeeA
MQNYHVITAIYIGPTNEKGSRIKLHSDRFEQTVIISFNHETFRQTDEIAIDYLQSKGFDIIGKAEKKDGYFLISNTFEPLKK